MGPKYVQNTARLDDVWLQAKVSHCLPQAAQSHKRTLEVVEAGYMTISFTDEDCNEARYNFTARRDALVSAGAQIIKTDFPTPATFFPSNYSVCSKPSPRCRNMFLSLDVRNIPFIICGGCTWSYRPCMYLQIVSAAASAQLSCFMATSQGSPRPAYADAHVCSH